LILDSSVIIAAERKRQTVEELLTGVAQAFGEIEIAISAVTLAELVHGVARANTPEIRIARRAFIDELKKHVPVQRCRRDSRSSASWTVKLDGRYPTQPPKALTRLSLTPLAVPHRSDHEGPL